MDKPSAATGTPRLNILDQIMRLSLCASPPEYGAALCFPALSTYRVKRVFDLEELRTALSYYFIANPIFHKCELQERVFDSPDSFKLQDFQRVLVDEYPRYHEGFFLMSVRYKSDPQRQGIFTCFPLQLMDGFKCFLMHQTLMKSLKTRRDEFRMAQAVKELGLHTADLAMYLPTPKRTTDPEEDIRCLPFRMIESEGPVQKIIPYLEDTEKKFVKSRCQTFLMLKNVSYGVANKLLFGNHLMYLTLSQEKMAGRTGQQIKQSLNQDEDQFRAMLQSLNEPEEFVQANQVLWPRVWEHPEVYVVNNYGDCTAHRGQDVEPEKGLLVRYQWHMPSTTLSMLKEVHWTISLGDTAFGFAAR